MLRKPKILFVSHNHPDLHPGGTEIFSHGLFQAMKARHGLEAVYLACVNKVHRGRLPGTLLQSAGRAPDEILLWAGHFDRFTLSQIDLHGIVPEFERLLLAFRPDIVHFHHVLLMGVEALQVVRRVLPDTGIVLTLHDYYPICANDGQMVTARDRRLCRGASADSCASCFPDTPRDRFVMRELFIKQNLSLVDRFISPSEFLKRRYIEWGLPAERIEVVRNGIREAEPAPHAALPPSGRRDRFAYFGHLNPFKGALVAIEAAKQLAQRPGMSLSLTLHGSADFQTDAFKAELAKACEGAPFIVTRGRYSRDEVGALMAESDWVIMPSIWWENAPLIIQEAFQHRRPVICSGIGGMAEAVRDRVDGLFFNPGDSRHLADRMAAALDPALWMQLVAGIKPPRKISAAADDHLKLYQRIVAARRGLPFEALPRAIPVAEAEPAPVIEPIEAPTAERGVAMAVETEPEVPIALETEAPIDAQPQGEVDDDASQALIAICEPEPPRIPSSLSSPPIAALVRAAPGLPGEDKLRDFARSIAPAASLPPVKENEPGEPAAALPLSDQPPPVMAEPKPQAPVPAAAAPVEEENSFKSGHRLRRLLRGGG